MNNISKNLKRLRLRAGLTQEALADSVYVTRQAVSNWETGKNQPDVDMLLALAQIFDTDINELIYGPRPAAYRCFQRRHMLCVAACAGLLLLTLILRFTVYPSAEEIKRTAYNIMPVFLLTMLVPVAACAFGMLLPALLSFWVDIRASHTARHILLALGIALLLPVLGSFLSVLSANFIPAFFKPVFRPYLYLLRYDLGRMSLIYFLPFLSGICLFFDGNK